MSPHTIVKKLNSLATNTKAKPTHGKHCQFWVGVTQTYHDLTSLDEPDIFDINKNQNHILSQLIHTALKSWEACQIWYHKCCCSAIKKNLTFHFIPRPWKKLNPLSIVLTCSVAICKSIGNTPTDSKVYQMLFDSDSSKTLIHKRIVPQNFTPIPAAMTYKSFCLPAQPHPQPSWL